MWKLSWALLAFLEGTSADTYAAVAAKEGCVDQVGCKGYYRAFQVTTSPVGSSFEPTSTVTGISVGAIGAQAASSNNNSIVTAKVDVAGFRFKNPADQSDGNGNGGLSFYFGYLGITGNWDGSTNTKNTAGALAEVISILSSINVYYDNDNVPGFKWDLTQPAAKRYNVFNNANGEQVGYDTLDINGTIDLKKLSWTPMNHTKVKCNSIAELSTAPDGCEIHSLTTSGSQTASSAAIITVTARIASQPVKINGVLHGPEFAKFDVTVNFPWASLSSMLYAPTKAKVALIAFSAGKSGTFAASIKRSSDNSDSLVFAAQGTKAWAYYAYTPTATVDGASSSVTTQVVTGQQINDFDCTGAPCALTATALVALGLKTNVALLQAFGWMSSITFHSLGTTTMPQSIFWDPEVGSVSNTDATSANSAAFVAPSLLFVVALLLQ